MEDLTTIRCSRIRMNIKKTLQTIGILRELRIRNIQIR
nr:MAG TPA: hypothetical protein [Crassvirales sp.]